MSKKRTQFCLIIFLTFAWTNSSIYCQSWAAVDISQLNIKSVDRKIKPKHFKSITTDFEAFQLIAAKEKKIIIPLADGSLQEFHLSRRDVFHPDLSARYPGIQSYTGYAVDNPSTILKLSISHKGIAAMVTPVIGQVTFVDRLSVSSVDIYQAYSRSDFFAGNPDLKMTCHAQNYDEEPDAQLSPSFGDCQMRKFRLALACTGEYAAYHGGTVADVLAEYNVAMNRINGIYEKEAALTMELISNTDDVIFLDSFLDPYTNDNGLMMLGQNQTTLDQIIGIDNYDIGHVFSTGGGGIASYSSPCTNRKGRGVTGLPNPVGDPFYVDFVTHEMGHQFGAFHTFNNNCDNNIDAGSAYEPGSGSTIMAYAGICEPNVLVNSNDYFHAVSLQQIASFLTTGSSSCGEEIESDNNSPLLDPLEGNGMILPSKTPFELIASATDSDDDELTYCWEQFDNDIAEMPPSEDAAFGPAFRSYPPTTNSYRYFPELASILNGSNTNVWEKLTAVNRDMTFNVTVRDNNPDGGCTDNDFLSVAFTDEAGPFFVISQNSNTVWNSGQTETITWSVANTDQAPISCEFIDIYMSIDGGDAFDILLADDVPNNGSTSITVPTEATSSGRIKVKCATSLFFDINNRDITIQNPLTMSAVVTKELLCHGDADGEITANASGGTPPYSYSLDGINYDENHIFTDLSFGDYTVYAQDATQNDVLVQDVSIADPDPITIDLDISDYQVIINAEGGTGEYTYSLDGMNYSSIKVITLFNGLTYTIYVKDSNGCENQAAPFTYYIISNALLDVTDVSCKGFENGTIEVLSVSGGKAPYLYALNNSQPQEETIFFNLLPDEYELFIEDSEGNAYSEIVIVEEPDEPLQIISNVVENTITLNGLGGTLPYVYSIDGENYSSINVFSDLEDGMYTVYIKDKNGCLVSEMSIIINTSSSELEAGDIQIYPNPAHDHLYVQSINTISEYDIYNSEGKHIRSGKYQDHIDISSINEGTYLIKITSDSKSEVFKFVILR